uniref:Uncharacterized protein n=1 Tax=Knipowitschia caucasica TaxID=637954 RepID=A0AAV2JBQ5_KNICA
MSVKEMCLNIEAVLHESPADVASHHSHQRQNQMKKENHWRRNQSSPLLSPEQQPLAWTCPTWTSATYL